MLQRKRAEGCEPGTVPPIVLEVLRSPGQPLNAETRAFFEPRFGHDFSQVRVHTDAKAAESAWAVNARAYTVGQAIVFGSGCYLPGTRKGEQLLAHELTHTLQRNMASNLLNGNESSSAEAEANKASEAVTRGQNVTRLTAQRPYIAYNKDTPQDIRGNTSLKKTNQVVLIKINLTTDKVVLLMSSGKKYEGTVGTDLKPGSYSLKPRIAEKKWIITGAEPGLRFSLELENVDPWALNYSPVVRMEIVRGGKEDIPIGDILSSVDTVPITGDPKNHPNYIQNAVQGVGIFGWGGPFRLDRKIVNGMGVDSIYLPRTEINLDSDPLKGMAGALNLLYKSRTVALEALSVLSVAGMYTFYIGPGGHIYPTTISDTTAPALCTALRKAVEVERTDAKAAEKLSIDLMLWYVGARFPLKPGKISSGTSVPKAGAGGPAVAGAAASTGGEKALVFVEIGAGDLKSSIELAKKGGIKVIAVDPVAPATSAIKNLQTAGGTFIKGTAESLSPGTADHVFQYLPWRIGGTGSHISGGTWRIVEDTVKLLKPGGAAHFVTEDLATAEYLAKEASTRGLKAVITETTAGAAAPGASGAGVPGFSSVLKVWLVNLYK
jgi:hypothetical protein